MKRFQKDSNRRDAFSLVELLVIVAVVGVVLEILFPAIQSAREDERTKQFRSIFV